jgi:spermidine synthase
MVWRIAGFVLAFALLGSYRLLLKPAGRDVAPAPGRWNLATLFLASVLTLFTELALIRWIATEVRVFAYVKNLALLLCFLGFGLGCALARQSPRWLTATKALLGLVVLVRSPWYSGAVMESLSRLLGAAPDIEMWATTTGRQWGLFLLAAILTTVLLLLITCIFIPLGQTVSRQIELAPRTLYGYSWNLAGSLVGILAFFAVSWSGLPPGLWFMVVLAGMAILQSARRDRIALALAIVPVVLLLFDPSTAHRFNLWTPYQQISVDEITFPDGELMATNIRVNHAGYQTIVNLSHDFLTRHPELLKESEDENPYNLPFRFTKPNPRVLIVGSGTGNDVAAALRNQSGAVDAVEIDPTILKLGRRHPERPYSDPRVFAHLTDARSYMKRASGPYDLILFGLLDSHTQLSDYSNMRIDNFVYTEESFREARALLSPDGLVFIKFYVNHPWLGRRLDDMLTHTFGKAPVVFVAASSYGTSATCFAISPSGQVQASLVRDSRLRGFVERGRPSFLDLPAIPVTTDDWPYLYQKEHSIPGAFFSVSVLVVLLALAFYLEIPEARSRIPSLFFFSMGAGFLLLETQVVSRLALYFGTTWQVNGIVIAAVLAALLVANYVTEKRRNPWPRSWMLALLLLSIAFVYLFPFNYLPLPAATVGLIAAAIFGVPVFFAGLLFASEFRAADSPGAALGANMLGAVVGGLLENLSLIIGMKALVLVAACLYALAGAGFRGLARLEPAVRRNLAARALNRRSVRSLEKQ